MNTLLITYKNELKKLSSRKLTKVIYIILAIVVALFSVGVGGFQNTLGIAAVSFSELSIWTLDALSGNLLLLFTIIVAANVFSNEEKGNTLSHTLLRPVSRVKIFSAKNLAVATYILRLLGLQMGISMVAGFIIGGFTNITAVISVLGAYLSTFVVLVLFALITTLLALIFSNTSIVIVVALVATFVLNLASTLFLNISMLFPTSYFNFHIYLLEGSQLGILMLLFIVSYYIILTISGILLYDRKNF